MKYGNVASLVTILTISILTILVPQFYIQYINPFIESDTVIEKSDENEERNSMSRFYSSISDTLVSEVCYLLAEGMSPDLYSFNPVTTEMLAIGTTGKNNIESMAIDPINNIIYAIDEDEFGIVNPSDGAWTTISVLGNIDGALGTYNITDVDGLTYDVNNNILWASERKSGDDLIFQIDPNTGLPIPNIFGPNIDYIEIVTPEEDIDDIAIHPNGTLYAISNEGSTGNQRLIIINTLDGSWTDIGNYGLEDVEGMTFSASGQLIVTTGDLGSNKNEFHSIDPTTGSSFFLGTLSPTKDVEACACRHTNFMNGVIGDIVWTDVDKDGIQDNDESGKSGVLVKLLDKNENPVSKDGVFLTTISDPNGFYQFSNLAFDEYIVEFELPVGYTFSPKDAGSDNVKDSDVDLTTGKTDLINLSNGIIIDYIDAGLHATEICNDGIDNDNDGFVDCDDSNCIIIPTINSPITAACINESITISSSNAGIGAVYNWNFGNNSSPATATGIGPHEVSYMTCGNKTVSLNILRNGCSISINNIISIIDVMNPVWDFNPEDLILECNSSNILNDSIANWLDNYGNGSASDDCNYLDITNNFADYHVSCVLTDGTEVQFTATDGCGNIAVRTASVVILDTQPPEISAISDITANCDNIPTTVSPSVTDGCVASPDLKYQEVIVYHPNADWKSTNSCSILYEVTSYVYDNKGTSSITDDEVSFILTVIGQNIGLGWSAIINGNPISGEYYKSHQLDPFLITEPVINFIIFDDTNSACATIVEINTTIF